MGPDTGVGARAGGARAGVGLAGVVLTAALGVALAACSGADTRPPSVSVADSTWQPVDGASAWTAYGADAGGTRYAAVAQIDRSNVASLQEAWRFSTGDVSHDDGSEGDPSGCGSCHTGDIKFEATPILRDGRLLVSTPLNRVLALDPERGTELWRFDPHLDTDLERNEGFVSRGVAYWKDEGAVGTCASRVLFGTVDARLFALDAATGQPCRDFGEGGVVRLDTGVGEVQIGQYGVTSPPVVVGDWVVTGSSIGDNRRVDMERGVVRAFDVRTGALVWSFDPIPRKPGDAGWEAWTPEAAAKTGAANAWAPMSTDEGRGLVFVPTGSAAPDYYGGERPGDNRYANSVVALDAATGAVRWHFQVVHHDLWDFDVAAQPTLVDLDIGGRTVPAVVVATKIGFLFVLDRETGEPIHPVEERPVPQAAVAGEAPWPTQPFPVVPAPLHPFGLTPDDAWGPTPDDRAACRDLVAALRWDGLFTPPSEQGTLVYPGFAGGVNWGGVSVRPDGLLVVNHMRLPMWVRLMERSGPGRGNQLGTPWHMERGMVTGPSGMPCSPPPWGLLTAVDLASGDVRWEVPLGQVPALAGVPGSETWGSLNVGGPMMTSGGLVFVAATMDPVLRAFDQDTGRLLWRAELPTGAHATPMTYEVGGRQYVVVAAGGHASLGSAMGDWLVAFALPGPLH